MKRIPVSGSITGRTMPEPGGGKLAAAVIIIAGLMFMLSMALQILGV